MSYRCYTLLKVDRFSLDLLVPKLKKEATSRKIELYQVGQELEFFATSVRSSISLAEFALNLCKTYLDDDDEPALRGAINFKIQPMPKSVYWRWLFFS